MNAPFRRAGHTFLVALAVISVGILLCTGESTTGPSPRWQPVESGLPRHATITSIAIDPGDPQTIWAATDYRDTLYRSTDSGQTWAIAAANLRGIPVFRLAFGHSLPLEATDRRGGSLNPTLYAATAAGIYRWTGADWQPVGLPGEIVYSLLILPQTQGKAMEIFAGPDTGGLYRSADGGRHWDALGLTGITVLSLAYGYPKGDGEHLYLYAGTAGHGLYRSQDGGQTWHPIGQGIEMAFASELVADPYNPDRVYVRTSSGLYRTQDGGRSWERLGQGLEDVRVLSLAGAFQGGGNSLVLYAGTARHGIYKSTDGGDSWQQAAPATGHITALAVSPATPDVVVAGGWHGYWISKDGGEHWQKVPQPWGRVIALSLIAAPDNGTVYVGTTDGVFRSRDGESWEPTGLQGHTATALGLDQANPERLYAGLADGGVWLTHDGAVTWQPTNGPIAKASIPALAVAPYDGNVVYARIEYNGIYKTTNGGSLWEAINQDIQGVTVFAIVPHPRRPWVIYMGGDRGVYISYDGGAEWHHKSRGLSQGTILALALSLPCNSLLAGATDGIYRSEDEGEYWQYSSQGLGRISVSALLFHPERPQVVFAGTRYHGIFKSLDCGHSWRPLGLGLAKGSVNAFLYAKGYLYAATDEGLFRLRDP